jgi:FtsP/CotA-like multicopper oxidase with cupredoxin domain
MELDLTRRQFLQTAGALVIAFGLPLDSRAQDAPALRQSGGPLPANQLDSWLIIHKDGTVTVLTGK